MSDIKKFYEQIKKKIKLICEKKKMQENYYINNNLIRKILLLLVVYTRTILFVDYKQACGYGMWWKRENQEVMQLYGQPIVTNGWDI